MDSAHAGHGADLGQFIGGEPVQLLDAGQAIADEIGKDEQQTRQLKGLAPLNGMALDAQKVMQLPNSLPLPQGPWSGCAGSR